MVEERRQHARLAPSAPMFVSLDASKCGLLLDVCQGGVAVASLIPRSLEDVVDLEFELPEGGGRVSARVEITWTRDSGHLTGARFLHLDEVSRQQLNTWIRTVSPAGSVVAVEVEPDCAPQTELEAASTVEQERVQETEPETEPETEQASLFGETNEPLDSASAVTKSALETHAQAPVEQHPVDSYFFDPPKVQEHAQELLAVGDGDPATESEEPVVAATADADACAHPPLAPPADTQELATGTEPCELPVSASPSRPEPAAMEAAKQAAASESTATGMAGTEEATTPTPGSSGTPLERKQDSGEAQMHLARAGAFDAPMLMDSAVVAEATDLTVQPWYMPRAAGTGILSEAAQTGGSEKSRHTIELILAVVLLSWALVFLGYHMGTIGPSKDEAKGPERETKADLTASPAKGLLPSVEASPAPSSTPPHNSTPAAKPAAELALGDGGMVLQVGAMKLEGNADALARELQKKNMPAFVFRNGSDRLYRVAVGPYSDQPATEKAKSSLEKQGLKPILRRWMPE